MEDIYSQINDELKTVLTSLTSCSEDLKEIYVDKEEKKEALKEKMKIMRQKMVKAIERYIDDVEKEILNSLGGKATNMD